MGDVLHTLFEHKKAVLSGATARAIEQSRSALADDWERRLPAIRRALELPPT